jgi:hypothetical protein
MGPDHRHVVAAGGHRRRSHFPGFRTRIYLGWALVACSHCLVTGRRRFSDAVICLSTRPVSGVLFQY